jgi:hypothetical protein
VAIVWTVGSLVRMLAMRIWLVAQICSAVTLAFNVVVKSAFRSASIASRMRKLPHMPTNATNSAIASGITQTGNLLRPVIILVRRDFLLVVSSI